MKVLCIIPARSGSKQIKNKNIIKIGNKPLIYYTISFAKKLKFVDKIIFSSDSNKYIKIAKSFGMKDFSVRPKYLSNDNALMANVVKYELKQEYKNFKNIYDSVLILQPTSPFRNKKIFYKAFKILKNSLYDSVISISEVRDHPFRMKKILKKSNRVINFMNLNKECLISRQQLPKVYIRAGSMYFTKVNAFLNSNSLLGKKVYGFIVNEKFKINVDNFEDLLLAKYFINKKI